MRFSAAMESTLRRKHKCARFTCFRREDSQKYLNEIIFTRDGGVPWCLHGLLFIQQKVNILEIGSIHCRLYMFRFHAGNSCMKYNNSDECEWNTTIISTCSSYKYGLWNHVRTRRISNMFEEQSFDQSPLKELTKELSRAKKVRRRKKVLAGKECASIQALYLPLRIIYF